MISDRLFNRFYPSSRYSGTALFYNWVREHVDPRTRMLNLGAGPPTNSPLRSFKGEVAEVVGADPDPIVLANSELDHAVVLNDDKLPFSDDSFDLILSDYVLEHVKVPIEFLCEVRRVLRPSGSFFFRTPNLCHYVALISMLTPHWFHKVVANRARNLAQGTHEPWPTYYRMNTRPRLRRLAISAEFDKIELRMIESEPSYLVFSEMTFVFGVAYERLVNSSELFAAFRANMQGRLVKGSVAKGAQ